jgi:DNA polymerase III subunit epsilon
MTFDFIDKDLIFIDLEATGPNFLRDRIVQLALIKYRPGGEPIEWNAYINPGIAITPEAFAIHGLDSDRLSGMPTFKELAREVYDFIGDADMVAYNSYKLDIPILVEEFARVGLDWPVSNRRIIDAQRIFYKMEPRTLKAALKFYTQQELSNAHDALADARSIVAIFKGQLEKYQHQAFEDEEGQQIISPIQQDIQKLYEFTNDQGMVDVSNRLRYNADGQMVFNFGKYIGQPVVEVFRKDRNFYYWIQSKEFSIQVKNILKKLFVEQIEKNAN